MSVAGRRIYFRLEKIGLNPNALGSFPKFIMKSSLQRQKGKGNWCLSWKYPGSMPTFAALFVDTFRRSAYLGDCFPVLKQCCFSADLLSIKGVFSVPESPGLPSEIFQSMQGPYVATRFNEVSCLWEYVSSSNFFPLFSVLWLFGGTSDTDT